VRVHPELLQAEHLPPEASGPDAWTRRFREINDWERYLVDNGIHIVKLFLNMSWEEQRERFLARIDRPDKNWKFTAADVRERAHWDEYQKAYSDVLTNTSTTWAPWYVIPSNRKWFRNLAVAEIVADAMDDLKLTYPKPEPGVEGTVVE